jgi:hypothetical protein
MIDPISTGVSVKTLVDLFKTGLGLIDRAKKDKQKKFNDVYKPLYLELEKIANRYHKIIQEAVHRLSKDKPDFDTIIREIKEGRDQLVFIRYAVIGKSRSLLERYDPVRKPHARRASPAVDKFAQSVYEFAKNISTFFLVCERAAYNDHFTIAQGLIIDIQNYQNIRRKSRKDLDTLRKKAQETLTNLELQWLELSQSYAKVELLSRA